MKTIFTVIAFIFVLLVSCSDDKKTEQDTLYGEVMTIHDEVMPKMGDIMKYKKQLKEKIAEITEEGESDQIEVINKTVQGLDNAHDEMMNWMHGFNRNFEGMSEDEVMTYLKSEKTKIEKVASTTNDALKNAEDILSK